MSKRRDGSKVIHKRCRLRPTTPALIVPNPPVATHVQSTTSTTQFSSSSTTSSSSSTPTQTFSDQWKLQKVHNGSSFSDDWDFWDSADPTHGAVNFQNAENAWNQKLIEIQDGKAVMRVDSTNDNVGYRNSVRIHDKYRFNVNSILIMDAGHMPTGCATWPAFWANGDNWPTGGEIDIVEGVHNADHNQATLHTKNGCNAVSNVALGHLLNGVCDVEDGDNSGCGYMTNPGENDYGTGFNGARGGVYVVQWMFSPINQCRGHGPSYHLLNGCTLNQYFTDQFAIFDTTLCGDWAGAAWESSGCAASTGFPDCGSFVSARGDAFREAYWKVNYVKYFTQDV
ncbi:hypothetical protein CPB86DRAFT_870641 [Serendipita vermifera]|nr:hypothetical protein CPB86DRAFT_870641 [Serendipita vermifera]